MLAERLHADFPGLAPVLLAALGKTPGDRALCDLARAFYGLALDVRPDDPVLHERLGEAAHLMKRLEEAGDCYRRALALDPPYAVDGRRRERVLALAPRLLTHAAEYFPLRDVVALHHPDRPLIAYHLFWDDDYNFPDDYDPCDHEQLWVAYDPESLEPTAVRCFFHSLILNSELAVAEARENGGRPVVRVEWGLHGSLPAGWEELRSPYTGVPIRDLLERNHRSVAEGGRVPDHPIKRRWPARFEGDFADYVRFDRALDTEALLREKDMIAVAARANATLQQRFLPYNFAPKFDWPFLQSSLPGIGW